MHSTAFVPPVYEINMKTLPLWPLDAKKQTNYSIQYNYVQIEQKHLFCKPKKNNSHVKVYSPNSLDASRSSGSVCRGHVGSLTSGPLSPLTWTVTNIRNVLQCYYKK